MTLTALNPHFGAVSLYRDGLRKPVTAVSVDRALVEEAGLEDRVKLSAGGYGSVYTNGEDAYRYRTAQMDAGTLNTRISLRPAYPSDKLPPMTEAERRELKDAYDWLEGTKRAILAKLAGQLGIRKTQ